MTFNHIQSVEEIHIAIPLPGTPVTLPFSDSYTRRILSIYCAINTAAVVGNRYLAFYVRTDASYFLRWSAFTPVAISATGIWSCFAEQPIVTAINGNNCEPLPLLLVGPNDMAQIDINQGNAADVVVGCRIRFGILSGR